MGAGRDSGRRRLAAEMDASASREGPIEAPSTPPDEQALKALEIAHFDDLWGQAASTPMVPDTGWTFRWSVTPAYLPGGTKSGATGLRAYHMLTADGIAGREVLDYGCGLGKWSIHLAQLGAKVSGFDISEAGIQRARDRAAFNGLEVRFDVADASSLPYESESFDRVFGSGIVHHVIKYERTALELHRVMRPGAIAIFNEPAFGQNPAINLGRRFTMRGKDDAGDVLLTEQAIREWANSFAEASLEGHSLFYSVKKLLPTRKRLLWKLHQLDENLFRLAPRLRRYGCECLIVLRK